MIRSMGGSCSREDAAQQHHHQQRHQQAPLGRIQRRQQRSRRHVHGEGSNGVGGDSRRSDSTYNPYNLSHYSTSGSEVGGAGRGGEGGRSRTLRHSVVSAIPDHFISSLYPEDANFVLVDAPNPNNGRPVRSPKSLTDLAMDTLCRSLTLLNGALPRGLPFDVVNDVVASLVAHSALNLTTLRIFKHCELQALCLAGCRGVNDVWLEQLVMAEAADAEMEAPLSHVSPSTTTSILSPPPLLPHFLLSSSPPESSTHVGIGVYGESHPGPLMLFSSSSVSSSTAASFTSAREEIEEDDDHDPTAFFASAESLWNSPSVSTRILVGAITTDNDMDDEEDDDFSMHSSGESRLLRMTVEDPEEEEEEEEEEEKTEMDEEDRIIREEKDTIKQEAEHRWWSPASLSSPVPYSSSSFLSSSPLLRWSPPSVVSASLTLLDLRGSCDLTDRGLLQLNHLSQLEVAKLDNCHRLVGYGLWALASSIHLHTLSLTNCRRLTDEAVMNISHITSLEALALDGCRCVTNRSLFALTELVALRKLGLSQCDLITDAGLEPLQSLPRLEELSIGWCRLLSDTGIDTLTQQLGRTEHLKVLRMARVPISDEGVAHLGRLRALEELDLSGCSRIGSAVLGKTLQGLTQLHSLDISYCPGIMRSGFQGKINQVKTLELSYSGVKDAHMSKLTHLPALEELRLDSCPIGDWTIAHLADNQVVPKLKSLDLADTDLSDAGMAKIALFEKLTRLSLFYCNITNAGLRHLSKLKDLEVLNLDSREISDLGLRHLQCKRLKSLDIFSGRITDAGCAYIAQIQSLESLELCGGGIGDLGCTALATLDNLTSLNLSQNERITNRGAAALAALTNLKMLNLSNTRVDSAALRFFGSLLKLQSLSLYGCRGIDDSCRFEKLQDELPNLKCLHLNRPSDQDGVMLTDGSSDEESVNSTEWSDHEQDGSMGMPEEVDV